eukprot:CAMPEP_0185723420 /NCGR_PEP_ID=MMETSP1171-20130828/270_1 /TAXON_ID=374046 /ORGANISM="Helicotheca tamensis, Strain CCMP826" /LENGTH=159 /DNA_ID=CAMNT_0028391119 /DNA_START=108 /DNA_END=587 /DNA_ORIENTATION=+
MKFVAITSMFVSVTVATAKPHLRVLHDDTFDCDDNNPCVPLLHEGQFYYPNHAEHKFVQCSEYGDCDVMPCPTDEVWSVEAYTCVWSPIPSSMPTSAPTPYTFNCDDKNPCDPLFTAYEYYYPHVEEDKFVQCDAHGGCYVRPCPEIDEVWDKELKTCV